MRYQESTETDLPHAGVDTGVLVGTVTYSLLLASAAFLIATALN